MIERSAAASQSGRGRDRTRHEIEGVFDRPLERRPWARPAVTAADNVHPVPCVDVVSIRGCVKRRTPPAVTSTSVMVSPSDARP